MFMRTFRSAPNVFNVVRTFRSARHSVLPFINTVTHKGGEAPASQGVRRENTGSHREYLTDEQRSEAGCIAGRMPPYL
jgi:hypothetical protein